MKKISNEVNDKNKNLVPDEDYEYEKELAAKERKAREDAEKNAERRKLEQEKKKREQEKARERKIAQDRLALMKMRSGISDDDEIKEVHEEQPELHGMEKVKNIWYHDKIWILMGVFIIAVISFLAYDIISKVEPDITVMVICDNSLKNQVPRQHLAEMLEKYTPDLNGDGKVKVSVYDCALSENKTDQAALANSQKFMANIQGGEMIMVVTDSKTDPDYKAIMDASLTKELPDNPYVDEQGLSLNFDFLKKDLECPDMPGDVYLCLRRPVSTMENSLEEMQENYDKNLKVFKKFANALAKKAEQTNDKGISADSSKDKEPAENESK